MVRMSCHRPRSVASPAGSTPHPTQAARRGAVLALLVALTVLVVVVGVWGAQPTGIGPHPVPSPVPAGW